MQNVNCCLEASLTRKAYAKTVLHSLEEVGEVPVDCKHPLVLHGLHIRNAHADSVLEHLESRILKDTEHMSHVCRMCTSS